MTFCDLLRVTVLLIAGVATVLATVTVIQLDRDGGTLELIVTGAWWTLATVGGLWLGRGSRSGEAMSRLLAQARTATSLPPDSPARIATQRLWPIGAFAVVAGGLALFWPQVAAIGAGYALGTALAWRRREAAVTAIEDRDGVRFYVEPSPAFEPVRLIRTPGLGRDRGTARA